MPYKDAEQAKAYQREYRRAKRAGEVSSPRQARLPSEFRVQRARDVVDLLESQTRAVLSDEGLRTVERARCIGFLAGVLLKAIDAGDIALRLEALEGVLEARKAKR